jgi:hypothetical protein
MLPSYGRSYSAMWKRMLNNEKQGYVQITNSRNAIRKICKGMYKVKVKWQSCSCGYLIKHHAMKTYGGVKV